MYHSGYEHALRKQAQRPSTREWIDALCMLTHCRQAYDSSKEQISETHNDMCGEKEHDAGEKEAKTQKTMY